MKIFGLTVVTLLVSGWDGVGMKNDRRGGGGRG